MTAGRNIILRAVMTAVLCLCGVTAAYASAVDATRTREAIAALDANMDNRADFLDRHRHTVAALRVDTNLSVLHRYEALGDAYVRFDNDSAVACYRRALKSAPTSADRYRISAALAAVLPRIGFVSQAEALYGSIPVDSLDVDETVAYYEHGRQMYELIADLYSRYPDTAALYRQKMLHSLDALLHTLSNEKDTPRYRINYGEYMFRKGETVKAETLLREVFDSEPVGSPYRARAARVLAQIAGHNNDDNSEMFYLAGAVDDELMTGLRELPSLSMLADVCYRNGDVERAYRYLVEAMADGVESHSLTHILDSASIFPEIVRSYDDSIHACRVVGYVIIAVLVLAIAALTFAVVLYRRRVKRMCARQTQLVEANSVKDTFLTQFMNICAVYMDKLSDYNQTVIRRLQAGKGDDLLRMAKAGKYVETQYNEFFELLDNAFLHLYPTFVDDVNRLLRPDEQIVLREGERLNTDLRILAFMRMGITDSAKIALMLGYSINTIYTYRNKMKSKAINRDDFEAEVMKIQSI